MKDLRIVAKLYNNQLRERREALGLSAPKFAAKLGIEYVRYSELEGMRRSPVTSGFCSAGPGLRERKAVPVRWIGMAVVIADFYGVPPEVLWPEAVQRITKTTAEIRANAEEVAAMLAPPRESSPLMLLAASEETDALEKALDTLNDRERDVLRRRFGLDDGHEQTFDEIGERYGLSRERIRQIEQKALGRLKRADVLASRAR